MWEKKSLPFPKGIKSLSAVASEPPMGPVYLLYRICSIINFSQRMSIVKFLMVSQSGTYIVWQKLIRQKISSQLEQWKKNKHWQMEFTWKNGWDFFLHFQIAFFWWIKFARVNKYHSSPHGVSKVLSKENGPQIFRGNGLRELTFFLIPLKLLRCRIQTYWYRVQLETVRLFFGTVIQICMQPSSAV